VLNKVPSLLQSSSLHLRITRIKPNINDNTISLSVTVCKGPNADFDGDQMNLTLLIDEKMNNMAKTLDPHYNIVDLGYFKVNKNLYLPSTVMPNIANYLLTEDRNDGVDDNDIVNKLLGIS
jgi:hypothetical protein